ncbi:acyl-CoA dehydrogenase family protein, partial [Candidatus Riflebacteria bacterium]
MDFNLTDDQKMIQNMTRDFARKYISDGALLRDEEAAFSKDLFNKLAEQGILGMIFPEKIGGGDADFLSFALALEEIANFDATLAYVMVVHSFICCRYISSNCNHDSTTNLLTEMVSGKKLCTLVLENSSVTMVKGEKKDDHYILSGLKKLVPFGECADMFLLFALTDSQKNPTEGISAFLIPSDTKGLSIQEKKGTLGFRSSAFADISLNDVKVPLENLVGELNTAYPASIAINEESNLGFAAIACGISNAALQDSIRYSGERVQFGQPIRQFQAIRFMLADMQV